MLEGKVAVVTGGASGIGKGICCAFAGAGCAVAVFDRNGAGAVEVAAEIQRSIGGEAIGVEVDVAEFADVCTSVDEVVRRFGAVDIVVNCAALNFFVSPDEIAPEDWRRVQAVNVDGPWHLCKAVMPEMMRRRSGKIINIGSGAGILGIPKAAHYSTSKHAVVGLTRSLAVDLGPYNINVNCICPGSVPGTSLGQATHNPVLLEESVKRTPLGRLGTPADIANAAVFLASSAADWITGVVLPVDGGLTCCIRAHHWE